MNCIQPIAPAELGPMLRPKFDSILLIAASTGQGMPYIAPAPIHSVLRAGVDPGDGSPPTWTGPAVENSMVWLGSAPVEDEPLEGTTTNVSARAAPVTASATAATSRRCFTIRGGRRREAWGAAVLLRPTRPARQASPPRPRRPAP